MNARPDLDRIVTDWLHADATSAGSDRVLAAAIARTSLVGQERAARLPRFTDMNAFAKFSITAAAVLVVAVVGINLVRGGGPGGPSVAPSPSPSPTPAVSVPPVSPLDSVPPAGSLLPGNRYPVVAGGTPLTFSVPVVGWASDGSQWLKGHSSSNEHTVLSFVAGSGRPAIFTDACARSGSRQFEDSIAGSADSIAAEPGANVVTEPRDATVGGRAAKYVVISVPEDVGCANTEYRMANDVRCDFPGCWYPSWLDSRMRFWVVDLGGSRRLQILAESQYFDAGPDLDQEIQQIVESIQFER